MPYAKKRITGHAARRIAERSIRHDEIQEVLTNGKVIQRYDDDTPFPSYIILGWPSGRPLHVVAADDEQSETTMVITAYEPDPQFWDKAFERRI